MTRMLFLRFAVLTALILALAGLVFAQDARRLKNPTPQSSCMPISRSWRTAGR